MFMTAQQSETEVLPRAVPYNSYARKPVCCLEENVKLMLLFPKSSAAWSTWAGGLPTFQEEKGFAKTRPARIDGVFDTEIVSQCTSAVVCSLPQLGPICSHYILPDLAY